MIPTHDQLMEAMSDGYYPGYIEQPITFLPSYKMSTSEMKYVNKKEQAPSYCDRVLFKPNMPAPWSTDFYKCLHEMHGSDHRPVVLGITLNDFKHPDFQELPRLLDMENPRQGYGELKINLVSLTEFNFNRSLVLKKFVNPLITES